MQYEDALKELKNRAERTVKYIAFAEKHRAFLEQFSVDLSAWCIDINKPGRERVPEILLYFGGEWTKTYQGASIDYTTIVDGCNIRLWNAPPPPNCIIVEETREVPEEVVPAHTETIRKIVCR